MWEYIAVLLIGFWLGVAIFLYISCYWLDEIFDLPSRSRSPARSSRSYVSGGASGAHAQLKRLVARVVEEAAALPELARYAAEPTRLTPTIESSTYEDLLATAILNKVIERYQTENGSGGRSSGIHSASVSPSPTPSERSSPRSLHSRHHHRDISPPLREDVSDWDEGEGTDDTLELPRRVPFPEFGGDIVHNTENEDRDFDEVSSSDIQAVDGTWEENWLFQKKKIKNSQSVPVPMLVPNSNTDYRVLIGDRDADDTTDLSDNASDVDEDIEYKSDVKRIIDSKHVIGGGTKIEDNFDFEPDSLDVVDGFNDFEAIQNNEDFKNSVVDAVNMEFNEKNTVNNVNEIIHAVNLKKDNKSDSNAHLPLSTNDVEKTSNEVHQTKTRGVNGDADSHLSDTNKSVLILGIDSGPLPKAEFAVKKEIHRTIVNGHSEDNIKDLHYKARESKETNEEQEITNNLSDNTSTPSTLSRHQREREYNETIRIPVQRHVDSLRRKHFEDDQQQVPTRDTDEEDLIPGSVAYRERKKWMNYVEMPNNPYSPEAIQKRLSTKSNSSLFDVFTNNNKDIDNATRNDTSENIEKWKQNYIPVKEMQHEKISLTLSNENITNGTRSKSPSPKIQKDMLDEETTQYKRYGRDYYIKEAKASCGGRKKRNSFSDTSSLSSVNKSTSLDNFETDCASPGLLIQQFHTIAETQQYTKFAVNDHTPESITTNAKNNKSEIMIEYEDANEQTLFAAKPAYVDEETDKRFEEILQSARYSDPPSLDVEIDKIIEEPVKSLNNLSVDNSYLSSSSLDDSIKIYNVQTGEIIKSKSEDNISLKHDLVPDKNDNIDIDDKNIPRKAGDRLSENRDVDVTAVITEESSEEDKFELSEVDVILSQLPKVNELAKKFISMKNLNEPVKPPQRITRRRKSKEDILDSEKTSKHMYMHSLTARSISKEFRDELKLSMATPLTVPGGSKEIPEGEEILKESSRPGSPLPEPGTIKSKLAFFESLKNKLSSK